MKVLVLGAGGFIGRRLISTMSKLGYDLLAYGSSRSIEKMKAEGFQCTFITGDFATETQWDNILSGVELCFHLISTTMPKSSNDDPSLDVSQNLIGSLRLFDSAVKNNTRVIFTSSGGTVYGDTANKRIVESDATNPICSYGITKLAIEKYLFLYKKLYGLKSVSLRISNPYGAGQFKGNLQGVIPIFIQKVLKGEKIEIWGDGSVVRDYVYIQDVVDALILASKYRGNTSVFNVSSGIGVSLVTLIKEISKITNITPDIDYLPSRKFDVPVSILSSNKAKKEFNWSPKVELQEGLIATIDSYYKSIYENSDTASVL